MSTFLSLCIGMFGAFIWIDLKDVRAEPSRANWAFLIFNTGMLVFAAQALWERF